MRHANRPKKAAKHPLQHSNQTASTDPNQTTSTAPIQDPNAAAPPAAMESYFFSYTYTNHPIINGAPTTQSYIGSGFAPVGTYKPGQTITVLDRGTGLRQVGTYTIGNVSDTAQFDVNKINHITIGEYDYTPAGFNTTRITLGTGLGPSGGVLGLGSESGTLLGRGAEGIDISFNNQNTAINPIHF